MVDYTTSSSVPSAAGTRSVLSYGAACDGVTDDTAAFASALNVPTTSSTVASTYITVPTGRVCAFNSGLTIDASVEALDCNGSLLKFSSITSGTAITVVQSATTILTGELSPIRNCGMVGAGRTTSTTAIDFNTGTGASAKSSARLATYNMRIDSFGVCHQYRNNAYIMDHFANQLEKCGTAISEPDGFANYGERISYHGGVIADGLEGFKVANSAGDLFLDNVSIDYNNRFGTVTKGTATCDNCHLEMTGSAMTGTGPFTVEDNNGALLRVTNSTLLLNGTGPFTSSSSIFGVSGSGTLQMDNNFMHNTRVSSDTLVSGTGYVNITGTQGYNLSNGNSMVRDYLAPRDNLMSDGTFANVSPSDLIWISNDTAAVSNRVSGTNIALSNSTNFPFTGLTQSLKATKIGSAGSLASFNIAVPVNGNKPLIVGKTAFRRPGTQTGIAYVNFLWLQVTGYTTAGVPIVGKQSTLGTVTVDLSAGTDTGWLINRMPPDIVNHAPAWATHYSYNYNLNGMAAGDFYIGYIVNNMM